MTNWKPRLALFFFILTSWAGAAAAELRCPQPRSRDQARRLAGREFSAGQRLYDRSEYRGALERFECSYRLVPHRATLFNIARTAEAADELELALDRYEMLLTRYPDDPDRGDIEARVRRLRNRLEARRPPPPPPPEPTPGPDPTMFGGSREPTAPTSRMSSARLSAWIIFALGAASAIAGSVLVGVAASENTAYLEHRDVMGWSRQELFDDHQRGLVLENAGWAVLGVGATALVTSLILFFAAPATTPVQVSLLSH